MATPKARGKKAEQLKVGGRVVVDGRRTTVTELIILPSGNYEIITPEGTVRRAPKAQLETWS